MKDEMDLAKTVDAIATLSAEVLHRLDSLSAQAQNDFFRLTIEGLLKKRIKEAELISSHAKEMDSHIRFLANLLK